MRIFKTVCKILGGLLGAYALYDLGAVLTIRHIAREYPSGAGVVKTEAEVKSHDTSGNRYTYADECISGLLDVFSE